MTFRFVLLAAVVVIAVCNQSNASCLLPPLPPPPGPTPPSPPPAPGSLCSAYKQLLKYVKTSSGTFCPPIGPPSLPSLPGWPPLPGWPSLPSLPSAPGYPPYLGYPPYPVYPPPPSEPAPQIDQKPDVTIPLPLPPSIPLGNFCSCQKYTIKPSLLPAGSPPYPPPSGLDC